MGAPEANDCALHEVSYGRATGSDRQGVRLSMLHRAHAPQAEFDGVEALERRVFEYSARCRRHNAARVALEESHAQFRLEPRNVLTDRGLSAAKLPRERAQVAGFAGRNQDPKVFERHDYI